MLRVKNESVWRHIRTFFIGSAVLFLINIYFGFDNALTSGAIPRSQLLVHLHAGSIGWITLSQIAIAVWVFTGQRDVSENYARRVRSLAYAAVGIFAGYIVSFGLAFSQGGGFFTLLPIFGTLAMLTIWVAAIYALTQLRRQPLVSTVHVLVAGGLLIAAVGATMGVLLGLELAVGRFLPLPPDEDRVGLHAAMMDTYLILVAAAIVEWFLKEGGDKRWSVAGLLQTIFLTVAGLIVPIAFLTGAVDQLLPIFALLLMLGLLLFLARTGRRAVAKNPLKGGVQAWGFFGSVWLVIYVGLFIYAATTLPVNPEAIPLWFFAVFAHSGFVGMMTNLIFGVYSARTQDTAQVLPWGEPVAMWGMNLGLLIFLGLKIGADNSLGAIAMGLGVLLGVFTMVRRLQAGGAGTATMAGRPEPTAAD